MLRCVPLAIVTRWHQSRVGRRRADIDVLDAHGTVLLAAKADRESVRSVRSAINTIGC